MNCDELRNAFYEGDEAPLREHSGDCSECAAWLAAEDRLWAFLGEVHAEAAGRVEALSRSLERPDRPAPRFMLHSYVRSLAVAAAILIAVGALYVYNGSQPSTEVIPTRVVVIEGRVKDMHSVPLYVEIDGKRFDVKRTSATEGSWAVEVLLDAPEREYVLTAVDSNGNRTSKLVRLSR